MFQVPRNRASLEHEQATLFLSLGLIIVLSGGEIINDDLYVLPTWKAMLSGTTQFTLGVGYWLALLRGSFFWRHVCSMIAAPIWFSFIGLYLSGPYHRVGAITVAVFAVFRVYDDAWLWYWRKRQETACPT